MCVRSCRHITHIIDFKPRPSNWPWSVVAAVVGRRLFFTAELEAKAGAERLICIFWKWLPSWKLRRISATFVLSTYRKSDLTFQLVPIVLTVDDLERSNARSWVSKYSVFAHNSQFCREKPLVLRHEARKMFSVSFPVSELWQKILLFLEHTLNPCTADCCSVSYLCVFGQGTDQWTQWSDRTNILGHFSHFIIQSP